MSGVPFVSTVEDLRAFVRARRQAGERIGLVPTMGALHAGHLSLVDVARRQADRVIVTIFVNPTQFAAGEDFTQYPRTLEADVERLANVGADLVFAPPVEVMYPSGFVTTVSLDGPAKAGLEDRFRPTHFSGVATVVTKLLNQAQADVAVFGEKDYQQLLVIRRLARDLDIATRILAGPTLRDADGLAMSSRNVYLPAEERAIAPALHEAMGAAAARIARGEAIDAMMRAAREVIGAAGFVIDYVEARNAETLAPITRREEGPIRILAAAKLGGTRLIDNVAVEIMNGGGEDKREAIRLVVEGRVQGVGYRAFLVGEANALGLAGWARNRADGSVEAVAHGSPAALEALIDAARRGPPAARVDRVTRTPADPAAPGDSREAFTVAPTV